jgi:hypothetical protein
VHQEISVHPMQCAWDGVNVLKIFPGRTRIDFSQAGKEIQLCKAARSFCFFPRRVSIDKEAIKGNDGETDSLKLVSEKNLIQLSSEGSGSGRAKAVFVKRVPGTLMASLVEVRHV